MKASFAGLIFLAIATATFGQADLSTPKAAARSMFVAIQSGDIDAIRNGLYQASPQQSELAGARAELIVAGKRLGDAMHARFPGAAGSIGGGTLDPADLQRLDQATVEQSGDRAKLTVPGQNRPMSFRRQDGLWRLVISDTSDATPEAIAKQTLLVHMMAEAMNTSATEISSGTHKTPESAVSAIQGRLRDVMLKFERPSTTRASTNPTTAPHAPATQP
jgi:hypothetical protein